MNQLQTKIYWLAHAINTTDRCDKQHTKLPANSYPARVVQISFSAHIMTHDAFLFPENVSNIHLTYTYTDPFHLIKNR